MLNTEEINNRLNAIKALESVKLRLVAQRKPDIWSYEGCQIYADAEKHLIVGSVNLANEVGRNDTFYGPLYEVINDINKFIKEKFDPLILAQKEAIKKLL